MIVRLRAIERSNPFTFYYTQDDADIELDFGEGGLTLAVAYDVEK